MPLELKVKIKDEDRKLQRDFLIYEEIKLSQDDPVIMDCVNKTLEEFKGEPHDIILSAVMVLK